MNRWIASLIVCSSMAPASVQSDAEKAVVLGYSNLAYSLYSEAVAATKILETSVQRFVAQPDDERLEDARKCWVAARRAYGMTEVFRFSEGPIDNTTDGVESLVNAWPIDEAYIDSVVGNPTAGIINDPERFPRIDAAVLALANERGGEANVSVGWHAIEFLLYGQDFDPLGPGKRSAEDFRTGQRSGGRRALYLTTITALLVEHLTRVQVAWAPDRPNHRLDFESKTRSALLAMLTGVVVLTGFEMAGERLAVPFETRDQEQEHSCFSDTTDQDLIANQRGILMVLEGAPARGAPHGLLNVVSAADPKLADALRGRATAALAALQAIPRPFDNAITSPEGAPARVALLSAIEALEAQAELASAAGVALGFEVPIRPRGL